MLYLRSATLLYIITQQALAQFVSLQDAKLTTLDSPHNPNITISYKVPEGACKTAFDAQKQFTGWVSIPIGDQSINLFFWFVEAREPTPALTIWLNGGTGGSSMSGFWQENGPCEVVEKDKDHLEVKAREWGWDRASNMLYIDMPSVGFSYTTPIMNGSFDSYNATTIFPPEPVPEWSSPWAFSNGTFSSPNPITNTTTTAHIVWHLLQAFLSTFPQYNPPSNSSVGINLFAKGTTAPYAPLFASYFHSQNLALSNGIINGCGIDPLSQAQSYATMAVNNSFHLPLLTPAQASAILDAAFHSPGSSSSCLYSLTFPYQQSTSRSLYDINNPSFDPLPNQTHLTYLNTLPFLSAISSPINFTDFPPLPPVPLNNDPLPAITSLLSQGVRIALLYSDRDYLCNWRSGHSTSLTVSSLLPFYSSSFPAADYSPIYTNSSYTGGATRQFSLLSFSRIYSAGHFPSFSQAETTFQIFARIILGLSLSTVADTCDDESARAVLQGKEGAVVNGVWYTSEGDWQLPPGQGQKNDGGGGPGQEEEAAPTTAVMTGIFTTSIVVPTSRLSSGAVVHGRGGYYSASGLSVVVGALAGLLLL
ncbi:Alpha/Beta hydrolase protein [Apiosordaria backusii]|uniref:Alpha/Beta hydrolase protein n=1 Tax=Apiosordaria backusii TaxID=314023 RepID=A0AA40EN02_9PEZI|nr:Alpha/Beta hydrolase protein [Apiosordaria backusii]